jgi:signal transduction histidine kinase
MDNAIKYNRDEGSIRVKGDMHWIKRKDFVKIEIIDSGNGISANDIKEIFERFYRVDKSRHKDTKGHGLGLSIAKEVIELHKGHVSVNSEIGKGTIFTIEIPALKSI